jgi:hypothetical protein
MALQDFVEKVQVLGRDLGDKVKSPIHEGNVRRIIVPGEHGNTFVEIPVTLPPAPACTHVPSKLPWVGKYLDAKPAKPICSQVELRDRL